MTTSINWPPTLPQTPTVAGYGETLGVHMLRTPVDAGPPKQRKIGNRSDQLTLGFQLTTAQVATLTTFAKTTVAGVKRFNFTHPRTGAAIECRLVPSQEGELFALHYLGPNLWQATVTFEVLP